MKDNFKRLLYFPIASYFRVFANIRLSAWNPKVIVVTGSYGKTSLLELIKSVLGDTAKYSDHANSAFGIPFDILGLGRKTLKPTEWFSLFLNAPLSIFSKIPSQKIYVVEADSDRPNEGKFLASLLLPDVTLWIGTGSAHGGNYEYLVGTKFKSVEEAIAYEYGNFLEYTKDLCVINGDLELEKDQLSRTKAKIEAISENQLASYKVYKDKTEFVIDNKKIEIDALLPKENFYSIAMVNSLCEYLGIENISFKSFQLPPGRSSVFNGIKNTTLIDSSYNASPKSYDAILNMYSVYPSQIKWGVFGDILELGLNEDKIHSELADKIAKLNLDKIIFVGPRVGKNTYPILLEKMSKEKVLAFDGPKDALKYIQNNLKGDETILFKGARFLEGIIEQLLLNKNDIDKLPRREAIWDERRSKWGV